MAQLLALPGISRTSDWFRWRLVQIGRELSVNPDYLSAVMSLESGFRPDAVNPYSGATGLIQFMPATAKGLGTTVESLRQMSAEDQLYYVQQYYRPFTGRLRNPGDAYMATFMPVYVGRTESTVLFTEGQTGYTQNRGLDRNKDGVITVGDVTGQINAQYQRGLNAGYIDVPDEEPSRPKVEE